MALTDVAFDAGLFHTHGQTWAWTVAEAQVEYYRISVVDDIATVEIYIEQGSTVGDDGGGIGPTHLCIDLPAGVTVAGYAQAQLGYTVDANYADFPNDGLILVDVGSFETSIQVMRISARWPPGVNVAFWGTLVFPVIVT